LGLNPAGLKPVLANLDDANRAKDAGRNAVPIVPAVLSLRYVPGGVGKNAKGRFPEILD
jgi:hypothetical protein